jgi:hypothetical protein
MDPQAKRLNDLTEFLNRPLTMLQYLCLVGSITITWLVLKQMADSNIKTCQLQMQLALRQAQIGRDVEILKEKVIS